MNTAGARLLNDCFDAGGKRLLHDEALGILRSRLSGVTGTETVDLVDAAGRICARDLASPRNIPAHDNSAVDGFAFASADHGKVGGDFPLSARITAGDRHIAKLAPGTAARIFTGAIMPVGADTVAMQEDCNPAPGKAGSVTIPSGLKAGANRRLAGEDVKTGEVLVREGQILRPPEIAALASAGYSSVEARSLLRVAVFSSGDEVIEPDAVPLDGQVFDANRFLLHSLMRNLPVEIDDFGIVSDDAVAVRETLETGAAGHHAILTTGGASRGEADFLADALAEIGRRHLWQLAVKPGRPMCFGQIGDCPVFSLPGNPVAAFVCFLLYVRPALLALAGGEWREPVRFPVRAGFDFLDKKPGRREFWRAWLKTDGDGMPVAKKFPRDGSGLISGLRAATGLIEVEEAVTKVARGDTVRFIPFSEFGIG